MKCIIRDGIDIQNVKQEFLHRYRDYIQINKILKSPKQAPISQETSWSALLIVTYHKEYHSIWFRGRFRVSQILSILRSKQGRVFEF